MYSFSVPDAAGIIGVCFYLGSYTALQMGLLRGQGYAYAALNLVAAALVLLSLQEAFNLSSAVIQVSWILISVVGMARYYVLNQRSRFNEEEQAFLQHALPAMEKRHARRLLDMGTWVSAEAGTNLAEEGRPVTNLVYLLRGEANVLSGGTVVATLVDQHFIGEMTALSGDPATATVTLSRLSRYLAIPAKPLRELLERNAVIRQELENCLAGQMKLKLVASNRAFSARTNLAADPDPTPAAGD